MGCLKSKPEAPKKCESDKKKSESKKSSGENENENAYPNYVSFAIIHNQRTDGLTDKEIVVGMGGICLVQRTVCETLPIPKMKKKYQI